MPTTLTTTCANCHGPVIEPWEETGRLCAACALDAYLFDRDARWEGIGP